MRKCCFSGGTHFNCFCYIHTRTAKCLERLDRWAPRPLVRVHINLPSRTPLHFTDLESCSFWPLTSFTPWECHLNALTIRNDWLPRLIIFMFSSNGMRMLLWKIPKHFSHWWMCSRDRNLRNRISIAAFIAFAILTKNMFVRMNFWYARRQLFFPVIIHIFGRFLDNPTLQKRQAARAHQHLARQEIFYLQNIYCGYKLSHIPCVHYAPKNIVFFSYFNPSFLTQNLVDHQTSNASQYHSVWKRIVLIYRQVPVK